MINQNELKKRNNKISELKQNIKKSKLLNQSTNNYLKTNLCYLIAMKKENESKEMHFNLRQNKYNQFSDDVRLTVIALMGDANVAAQNCSRVIQIVAKHLFHKDI